MQTLRVTERTGRDGVLHVRIPLGTPEADFDVVLVVQPKLPERSSAAPGEMGWPPGYFELAGSIDDPTFDRPPQGELPKAVDLDLMYLLDTNVWVAFLRHANSPVVPRLRAAQPAEVAVCSVVAAELYYGCLRSTDPAASRAKVDALLRPYRSLPFDDAAAQHFAAIRRHLETLGATIGPYDLQIAAIALAHGCALVTHNVQEFSRIPELLFEDWQSA